jgi:hypothetical protein
MKTIVTVLAVAALAVGCMEDGAQGPQGPAGEDGESYVSTTNPVSGEITTVAVTTGDNSPVAININTGADGSAGNRRPAAPAPETPAEEPAEEQAAP